MSQNLIVHDEYVLDQAAKTQKNLEVLNKIVNEYIILLRDLRENSDLSGQTADALAIYTDYASLMKDQLALLGECIKSTYERFDTEIDAADSYLF